MQALAVFCGSKTGLNPLYMQAAKELGILMAEQRIQMIYGGGRNGLMGCVADAVMQGSGTVHGIIPTRLIEWETQHDNITELTVVEDMHQRKRKMYELCDGVLILPGGFGTLDELFEVLTWNQLSLHDKKVFLLNTDGFYNHLLRHLQLLKDEGFLYGDYREQIAVLEKPGDLLRYINTEN